jgi:hypothetical protein
LNVSERTLWQRILAFTGIDAAIGWSAASQFWTALLGPVTLALVATRLTPAAQGYYFTFGSIVALQMIFELGLASVIQQFVSHEFAFLQQNADGTLSGDERHLRRLAALVQTSLRWFGVASLLFAVALLAGGTMFFARTRGGVEGWQGPWLVVAITAAAALVVTPALAILEGCGLVKDVFRLRTGQTVVGDLAGWSVLIAGGALWAPAAAGTATLLYAAFRIWTSFRPLFRSLLRTPGEGLSWREEVWPFQWRTAIGWISGYALFQSFTPLIFVLRGAAEAGRMGMSVAIVTTILNVSMAWLWAKRPALGMHVARREFDQLDALFYPAMLRSAVVMFGGCAAFVSGVLLLRRFEHPWAARMLDPLPLLLLVGGMLVMNVHWSQSLYLRSYKREALFGLRLTCAFLTVGVAAFLGRAWGAAGMMAGYFAVTLVVLGGFGSAVFLRNRREWRQ